MFLVLVKRSASFLQRVDLVIQKDHDFGSRAPPHHASESVGRSVVQGVEKGPGGVEGGAFWYNTEGLLAG